MRKILSTFVLVFGLFNVLIGQEVILPKHISISDKLFSPWGSNLYYEYELTLNEDMYDIKRVFLNENGKERRKKKKLGVIDKQLIEKILFEVRNNPSEGIDFHDFVDEFSMDSINEFFNKHAKSFWIVNDYQKQFIIEQLTLPDKLKHNLEIFFRNYDNSSIIDGSSNEVRIVLNFDDSTSTLTTKSTLLLGLPLEVNGQKNFSPRLARLLGNLIPESETKRPEQFKGSDLFSAVIRQTIGIHRGTLDYLESKTYQVYIDSLAEQFMVLGARVVKGTYSVNWAGEKRLNCQLRDSTHLPNIFFGYSTRIENGSVKFPVSLLINDYQKLYERVIAIDFFRIYLSKNQARNLSIVYEDNSSFTKKARGSVLSDCRFKNIDFDNSIFINLEDEFGSPSRWIILPSGEYFMWWSSSDNAPEPNNDEKYLKCK